MRILLCFLLYAISFPAFTQILNIEKDRLDGDTTNVWLGNTGFTFNARQQQVKVVTLNSFTNVAYLSERHDYIFIGNINLIKVKGKDVLSDGYAHQRVNWWRKNTISAETFMQVQYDESRGLRGRRLAGGGARLKLHQSDKVLLAFGSGLMVEFERWRFSEETENTMYLKSTNYASIHWKVSKQLNANFLSYYQARPDAFFHPRFISDANILISINRHFSMTTRFTATYDAIPVVPINKLIYAFTTGLAFRF